MALLECWIQECAQAEQHWLAIEVFQPVFLKGGGGGGGERGGGGAGRGTVSHYN